jgi:hypothetical protein
MLVTPTDMKDKSTFRYFHSVATARVDHATSKDKEIAQNVLRQLDALPPCADTAFHAYCKGHNGRQEQAGNFERSRL